MVTDTAELQIKRQSPNSLLEEVKYGRRMVHNEKVKPKSHSIGKIDPSVVSKNYFLQIAAVKIKCETIILKMKYKC